MSQAWRKKLSELGRGTGKPHAPLFAPLLYGVSSQIEALPAADVTADPTRLVKCLGELRRALGTTPLTIAAPSLMEAEALGADVDRGVWPPKPSAAAPREIVQLTDFDAVWPRSDALSASIEATSRISRSDSEAVTLAALTGPATLLMETLAEGARDGEAWEFSGRALASLSRAFATAGVSALLLCERTPPNDLAAWQAALGTISNIARFHRIPAILVFDDLAHGDWPSTLVPCSPDGNVGDRPQAQRMSADPDTWSNLGVSVDTRMLVTARDVDAATEIEDLADACEFGLDIEQS